MDIQGINLKLTIKEIKDNAKNKRFQAEKLASEADGLDEAVDMLIKEFGERIEM